MQAAITIIHARMSQLATPTDPFVAFFDAWKSSAWIG
jgi:hypothetical protein